MIYDHDNILARIIRNEIPRKVELESKYTIAIHDINPKAPIHILLIPKKQYISYSDFIYGASSIEIQDFMSCYKQIIKKYNAKHKHCTQSNNGTNQEIMHAHQHLLIY